jgi:rhamnose transport system substrate-binding protein
MKISSPLKSICTLFAIVGLGLSSGFAQTKNDAFELAMVIKETTNPYYNATLAGARIAAGEIGGTANNYGPTQASGQAQVDIINNLADRHVPAIAIAPSDPDAVVPAMKRAQKLGAKVIDDALTTSITRECQQLPRWLG